MDDIRLNTRQVFYILLTLTGLFLVPYLALLYISPNGIPDDFFHYPPIKCEPKPGPSLLAIVIAIAIGAAILLLYIFPSIFGFKKSTEKFQFQIRRKYFPIWFWIGLILFLPTLVVFTLKVSEPQWLLNWGLIPLFWGFTFILDGVVFFIDDGDSLIAKSPTEMVALGFVSISGWLFFDYLNFFIKFNWFYPNADQNKNFTIYATLGSSGFIPMAFEWYYLLRTSRVLNTKYKNGPKLKSPQWVLFLLIGIFTVGLALTPKYCDLLYFMIWIAPLVIIASVLTLLNIWTPFTSIKDGDWTAMLTFALTYFIQGFLLEGWNYMSASHDADGNLIHTYNSAYWVYCLPYVNVFRIFEMPVLGYMGYLFFSIHCYVWYITIGKLLGISANYAQKEIFK